MKGVIILALIVVAYDAVPSRPVIGIFLAGPDWLVVGGEDAGDKEFPFVVSIQVTCGSQQCQSCDGVIYNERRIITAGYCLAIQDASRLSVIAGDTDLSNLRGDEQSIRAAYPSKSMKAIADIAFKCNNYYSPEYDYNIGILTLAEPLIFSQNVQHIRLAIPTIEASGEVQVVAWGDVPNKLQKVNLNVINREVYKSDFSVINFDVTENMICALVPRRSTCTGDGGGALIAKDEARRRYCPIGWCGQLDFR